MFRPLVHSPTSIDLIIVLCYRSCFTTCSSRSLIYIRHNIVANNEYSLEFANDGIILLIFVQFWMDDKLCRVLLKRTGRALGQTQAEISLISNVMGAISIGPEIVSVTGCTSRRVQLLDDSPYGKFSVKSPPRFE